MLATPNPQPTPSLQREPPPLPTPARREFRFRDVEMRDDRDLMSRSGSYQAAMLTIARQRAQIESLSSKLAEMQECGDRKNRIMAAAGHDLKQPLHIISRALETLGAPGSDRLLKMWHEAATEQVGRLASGLTHLALASQEDGGETVPAARPLAMAAILDGLEGDWALAAADKGIELRVVRSSHLILSESRNLSTILANLVGNAIKYTQTGRVLVGCRAGPDQVRIEVIDTGCGIDGSEIGRIFEPFAQCGPARGGLGIGLSLVRTLCRSLGHQLSVSSRRNEGSRFTLTVPRFRPVDET